MRRRTIIGMVAIGLILVLFSASPALVRFYVDWLWFGEVHQRAVFWTTFWAQVQMALVFGLVFLALMAGNTLLAQRLAPHAAWYEAESRFRRQMGEAMENFVSRYLIWGVIVFSVVISLLVAQGAAAQWAKWLWFSHPSAFGRADPIFHQDISFYVFRLPLYEYIQGWIYNSLIWVLLVVVGVHYLAKAIRTLGGVPALAPHVKAHVSALLGAVLLVKAVGYWLDAYGLLYSPRGIIYGASYTDVHAQLLALRILMVIAVACAVLVLVNIRFRGLWLPAFGIGFLVVASILVSGIYPALIQRLQVAPNEFQRERPYITHHIEATNFAYGLPAADQERRFSPGEALTRQEIDDQPGTIKNIRLWDYRPLSQTYKQLQELRPYYVLPDVDIDRYHIDGEYRQVMLATRELSLAALQEQTWQNRHQLYTHGYGLVLSPVNRVSEAGQPEFWVKDIPPQTIVPRLKISRPGIYFQAGESTSIAYSIVRARGIKEIDYVGVDTTVYANYSGRGGIPVGGSLVRAAMATYFKELNLLITNTIGPDSRILIRRDVAERARTIAPFLLFDGDPYMVIGADGRLFWIHDAYTVTDKVPYAQPYAPGAGFNYIRNSVKVVTDAYDGTITFYVADSKDPVLRTYRAIFPGLFFRDLAQMPPDLKRHIRYPEDLFNIQADMYAVYHMRDPKVFYTKEDKWAVAREAPGKASPTELRQREAEQSGRMEAYYVIMRLPGSDQPEFILLLPFTPATKHNMIAWMCAKCDGADYGKLSVFAFPKDKLILGPNQIEAKIDQDPEMSSQLSLWRQGGSDVIRGNLLVIPIANSLLYVEPLFLKATAGAIPELTRVIVSTAGRVYWAPTLDAALAGLLGGAAPAAPARAPAARPGPAPPEGLPALIDEALQRYGAAQEKIKQADEEIAAGRKALERLKQSQQPKGAAPAQGKR
jgi:hypothetical protein